MKVEEAVILKRLEDAVADGDKILSVIRSSVVNNDGQTNQYMVAPSESSQAEMLARTYAASGLDPAAINYIEAHGTGTKVGDPTEIQAIQKVLGANKQANKLYVGSVKTNIGHTEAAAGIAGLIKTIMILQHRVIPASLHLKEKNSNIDWASMSLDITQENISLEAVSDTIKAGVNSFGITGTNAHVVLEEYQTSKSTAESPLQLTDIIFPISANSEASLKKYATLYADLLRQTPSDSMAALLADVCATKSHLAIRKAIVPDNIEDLITKLEAEDDSAFYGIATGTANPYKQHKVVFVFPGQGSQWSGMGKELFEQVDAFKDEILLWDKALSAKVDWSLTEELFDKSAEDAMASIDIIQPALVVMEVALTRVWQSWGIEPDAVLGHSMGEVAAAYIAGILSIEDAVSIICNRSSLMKTTSGQGAMGYIGLTPVEVEEKIAGLEDKLGIAVNNSPNSVVVSGDTAALDGLLESLTAEEVFCRKIKVDVASHSPQMDRYKATVKRQLGEYPTK